jgi:hypothetical protein
VAEGVGFEPTRACALPVFKTGAINHSTTPPRLTGAIDLNRHDGLVNRRYLYAAKQVCHRQAAEQASTEFAARLKIRSTGMYVHVNVTHGEARI